MLFSCLVHPALGVLDWIQSGGLPMLGLLGAVLAFAACDYGSSSAADARWGYYRVNGSPVPDGK